LRILVFGVEGQWFGIQGSEFGIQGAAKKNSWVWCGRKASSEILYR